ncbi:styrene monooxygenase subunit StyA [Alloalcanivorax profundimaris]|uniref:styrene monooxygenase subunit StyA n=1 Tax=Alloalcanivorax profundimaris TaxID=2735259 RepID=UPI001888B215|nr:styrene monooxygenase/indole monooxygenase family protein [Alloalcanivorax profundimaris]MBF1801837.1 monooxygenase [Alloalcanivorax profundimaris]
MRKRIAIVGAGAAGLHLGLYLRRHDIDVTLYSDRRPEDYRTARLLNTVAHHSITIARESDLGVNKWPVNENGYYGHYYYVGLPTPLRFYGDLQAPSRAVDYRIYLPELMKSFAELGGRIVYEKVSTEDLETLSEQYDLLVVCTGKAGFGSLFQARESATPFKTPQRALCVGLFKGIADSPIRAVTMSFSPGAGEMIEIPTLTFDGMRTALVMENHIGGELEILSQVKYEENPRAMRNLLLEKLHEHHPSVAERIDSRTFDLARDSNDILQGAVPPIYREGSATLNNGQTIMGLGDVMATVDPILGQGANMASHAARVLGEEIVSASAFDARFIEHVEARREDRVICATRWTNYMLKNLKELPPEFQKFIGTLSQNREMADEFTNNFNYPEKQWDYFSSIDRLMAWCEKYSHQQAA